MTPICPTCGCSLVRLDIDRADAARYIHQGDEYLFCCSGCVDLFKQQPEQYLAEVSDMIVCPSCLAEKPKAQAVTVEHGGSTVHLCRCPSCATAFEERPDELLVRLEG